MSRKKYALIYLSLTRWASAHDVTDSFLHRKDTREWDAQAKNLYAPPLIISFPPDLNPVTLFFGSNAVIEIMGEMS